MSEKLLQQVDIKKLNWHPNYGTIFNQYKDKIYKAMCSTHYNTKQ